MPRDKTGHFYYGWYPTIFGADTQNLSLAEDGAYRRLIDHYMLTRMPLPGDDRALARIVGVGWNEWEDVKDNVMRYFKKNPAGLFTHAFCDEELLVHNKRIGNAQNNGKKGGRPKGSKNKKNNPAGFESETQQKPITEQNRYSDTDVSGDDAPPVDFKRVIFNEGLRWFATSSNKQISALRPLVAKWCKDYGDAAVAAVFVEAQKFQPTDPTSFIVNALKGKPHASKPGTRESKTDRAKAAISRAAESGGFASGSGSQAAAGGDSLPMFPEP